MVLFQRFGEICCLHLQSDPSPQFCLGQTEHSGWKSSLNIGTGTCTCTFTCTCTCTVLYCTARDIMWKLKSIIHNKVRYIKTANTRISVRISVLTDLLPTEWHTHKKSICIYQPIIIIAAAATTTTHTAVAASLYYNTRNFLPCPLALLKHHTAYNCTHYATAGIAFIHCSD